jgi:hypothetical protein
MMESVFWTLNIVPFDTYSVLTLSLCIGGMLHGVRSPPEPSCWAADPRSDVRFACWQLIAMAAINDADLDPMARRNRNARAHRRQRRDRRNQNTTTVNTSSAAGLTYNEFPSDLAAPATEADHAPHEPQGPPPPAPPRFRESQSSEGFTVADVRLETFNPMSQGNSLSAGLLGGD